MTVPGVILAGGQGRRIGGDKAQRLLAGKPLWRHVHDRLAPQVSELVINGPDPLGSLPVIADKVPGLGPLGGILAAMTWAESLGADNVLTVAVDTPFLPADLVGRLSEGPGIAVAETQDGLHGTTALWPVYLSADLAQALDRGTRKVTDWAAEHTVTRIRFPETVPPPFFNVNTAEDLAQAEAWLG
ncbi:molybdenum cofactor guanylyltransferase MobA [Gymnodinialimonas hymeniacidonis]|uniref:molybdenum cofactor guanylyltransferase MobA n=1 Tax=Gymnodinialimonas hymeniacidonis TaxID=3126508 RepID=UPI0034C69459